MLPRPVLPTCVLFLSACTAGPALWDGPVLTEPRSELTVEQLQAGELPELLDLTFLARPDWAEDAAEPLLGTLVLDSADLHMDVPTTRDPYAGEDVFPAFSLDLASGDGVLVPASRALVSTGEGSDSHWDVLPGAGAVWHEAGDGDWSRASLPLDLVDRYFNQVRNCVATFVYRGQEVSPVYVQCSQETADRADDQLGDLQALVPATWDGGDPPDGSAVLAAYAAERAARIPTRPLAELDLDGRLAKEFDNNLFTSASTSVGAVYFDGTLYVHPQRTRHGDHPYPEETHHGVYSVTKSLAGALTLFHLAERYGDEVYDARIADHVPALAGLSEWADVTFVDALDMATGTNGGESTDLLFEPLVLADDKEAAIAAIAELGDAPEEPGRLFRYATTNTFVLSYAMDHFVAEREGEGVHAWDLVRRDVLGPIGADGLDLLFTRDEDPAERIPILGYGARPTLDQAARIARLFAEEGEHDGVQLLHRDGVRVALGRGAWRGRPASKSISYRRGFWARRMLTGSCKNEVPYMQGHGGNHVILMPSGAIVFRFSDENYENIKRLVRAVERVESSCE